MSQIVKIFIDKVNNQFQTGHAREHSYRPALEELFKEITGLKVVNEPKRSEYGAPDFVFLNKNIVTAHAEAKDLQVSLKEIEKSDQMIRYYGYSNLILTNCLEFRFYKSGQAYGNPIVIAELKNDVISVDETKFQLLEDTIKDFIKDSKEPIRSGIHLARVMAGKARRIRDSIKNYLTQGDDSKNQELLAIYEVIKKLLLADLDKEKFADMYSQTLVYGLFVARYFDKTSETFSRHEARDLVPASNPFLRHFFDHIAGSSFDPRIEMIVDELCEEFVHADVQAIVHNYYKVDKDDSRDPIIHFYEDFLQEYDSNERKKMGVFYTPLPVVRFIVRSIDDILKKEFGLSQGLADTSKIEVKRESQGKKYKDQIHKVQVLDPATGTGTFLNEIILQIKKSFSGQEGRWNNYVNEDLLPRLHGFELMMASYTIAHLKLSTTIKESGSEIKNQRLGVYLTNSLEKGSVEERNLFSGLGFGKAITDESIEAGRIKNDLPIMVVLGNPPYNVSSQNKNEYISGLIKGYKQNLNERKINLDDDYIKFIRFSEDLIEKNGEGIIGMITNNSFIDGITHRQMRKHLLETFDSIYILDLHGNSKKKEKTPSGGKDENVFAIQQGVSISLFIKTGKKKKGLANVYHLGLYGKQKEKFDSLNALNFDSTKYKKIDYKEPYYFFVPKDFGGEEEYKKGLKIDEIFDKYVTNIVTSRDAIVIDSDKNLLKNRIESIISNNENILNLKNTRDWNFENGIDNLKKDINYLNKIKEILYRPFDVRYIFYADYFLDWSRKELMPQMFHPNLALVATRQVTGNYFCHVLLTKWITEYKLGSHDRNSFTFPLYLYSDNNIKTPNLKKEIINDIEKIVGKISPEDILDYIYAVLYSPVYREKYKEFLKIDFPRVPYPKNKEQFDKLVSFGGELRKLHLLESSRLNQFITTYSESGDDVIEKKYPVYKDEKVYINDVQYFGSVPLIAWDFYIGGYQPAQKWLKDRRERKLSNEDIEHYQKMIIVLMETDRIMKEIDKFFN